MQLTDGVVVVCPPSPDDAPRIADAVQASLESLSAWMPWATPDYSAESARQWMDDARNAGRHPFLIVDSDGLVVGSCGLQFADPVNRCVQLGYWVGAAHTGRGYATRASRLAVAHAFDDLDFHRVEILASVHNRPSQRVAERLRARLEATLTERLEVRGDWHDARLYALVRDWT